MPRVNAQSNYMWQTDKKSKNRGKILEYQRKAQEERVQKIRSQLSLQTLYRCISIHGQSQMVSKLPVLLYMDQRGFSTMSCLRKKKILMINVDPN